ncbi:MAG: DUF6495 family protein [Flavobacteriaceae bacterium]|nr:DUF6495 family protein [Flavobacteriaceae bacterium]
MKYTRLTQEQLNELHPEFINFLATQSITSDEWEKIKEKQPEVAEEELDIFSDLIWEGVLAKVLYLENIMPNEMHLFSCGEKDMKLIAIRIHNPAIDVTTKEGFDWFKKNFSTDAVEIMTATKKYDEEKGVEKFKLIQKGAQITQGDLFQWFDKIIEK